MKAVYLKYSVLCMAILLIGIGIVRDEHFITLKKAVNICLECIGVG